MISTAFSRHPFLIASLALSVFISGCGYTRQAALPSNIKTIYVDTVQNVIPINEIYAYQPGLEMGITKSVIRRFNKDGNLRVVPEKEADAVLEIKLKRFQQEGLRFNSLESVEEFRLFIVVEMKLTNRKTKEVIFEEPEFSGDAEYFVTFVRSIGREEASQRAIERLAKNIVDRVVEDW